MVTYMWLPRNVCHIMHRSRADFPHKGPVMQTFAISLFLVNMDVKWFQLTLRKILVTLLVSLISQVQFCNLHYYPSAVIRVLSPASLLFCRYQIFAIIIGMSLLCCVTHPCAYLVFRSTNSLDLCHSAIWLLGKQPTGNGPHNWSNLSTTTFVASPWSKWMPL